MSEDLPDLETIDPTTPHYRCRQRRRGRRVVRGPVDRRPVPLLVGPDLDRRDEPLGSLDLRRRAGGRHRGRGHQPVAVVVGSGGKWIRVAGCAPPEVGARRHAPRRGRGRVIVGVALALVVVLVSGAIGFAIESNSHSNPQSQANPLPLIPGGTTSPTPSTVPGAGVSHDPNRRALSWIVV